MSAGAAPACAVRRRLARSGLLLLIGRLRHDRGAAVRLDVFGVQVVIDDVRRDRRAVVRQVDVAFEVQRPGAAVEHGALGTAGAHALREMKMPGRRVHARLRVDVELVAGQRRPAASFVRGVACLGRVAGVMHDDVAEQRDGAALGVPLRAVADRVGPRAVEAHPVRHREVARVEIRLRLVGLDAVGRGLQPLRGTRRRPGRCGRSAGQR